VALQTKALIEEATRLQLLVAEIKAGLAGEQHSSRHTRIESLRSQSAAMAAAQAEIIARWARASPGHVQGRPYLRTRIYALDKPSHLPFTASWRLPYWPHMHECHKRPAHCCSGAAQGVPSRV
jgi:hypothetical protein